MKKNFFSRSIALVLAFMMILSATMSDVVFAASSGSSITRIFVDSYNSKAVLYDGQKLTQSAINKLAIVIKGQTEKGAEVNLPTAVKEKDKYIHSTNGKVKLTLYYGDLKKSLTVSVRQAKKLSAKATGSTLYEGQKLTSAMVNKVVNSTVVYKNGKKLQGVRMCSNWKYHSGQ